MLHVVSSWAVMPRSALYCWSILIAAIAISVAVRFALSPVLPDGFPYVTFFPAVVLTSYFAGVRFGIVAALILGIVSWYFFIPPLRSFGMFEMTAVALMLYVWVVVTDIFLIFVMKYAITRAATAEARSQELARSRELMFQELQHRVSNNLAVVASLLGAQRRRIQDPSARRALEQAAARVATVSRLQRILHDPSAQSVNLGTFLRSMAQDVLTASGVQERVQVDVLAEDVIVRANQAVPLGLIATELLSNAVEHGFSDDRCGVIKVRLAHRDDGRAEFAISDDGAGLSADFHIAETTSLGLTIARQFADQLDGELTIENLGGGNGPDKTKGVISRLVFPLSDNAAPHHQS